MILQIPLMNNVDPSLLLYQVNQSVRGQRNLTFLLNGIRNIPSHVNVTLFFNKD